MSSAASLEYDAIILGSGQGSTPLSTSLAGAGYKTLLIERTHIGGTCVNEGCTPTKTMVASGRIAYLAKRAADYGVKTKFEGIDMLKVRQRKRDIVEKFRGGGEKRTTGVENLDVFKGDGSFKSDKQVLVRFTDNEEGREDVTVKAKKWIFVSTGERPSVPRFEGLQVVMEAMPNRVLNSTTVMELDEVPESLIVLGGGYVGLEFAHLFSRLGAEVHVVQRAKQVLPREDSEVVDVLQDLLRGDGLQLHLNAQAVSITKAEGSKPLRLKVNHDGVSKELHGSHILLAAGRTPNTDSLNLEAAGIKADKRGYITVDANLETSTPGIFAMGDCKGPPAFTHVSYDDFRVLRDNLGLTPKPTSPEDKPVLPHTIVPRKVFTPYCCFTDPQLAHVGLHLSEISMSERANIQTASWPMSFVARGLETDETRGILKAVVNKETGQILGFTALAPEGGEMMTVVQMAMIGGLKWWDLREAIFAHPVWSEALNNIWGALRDAPRD